MARSIKNLVAAMLISVSGFLLMTIVWPEYKLTEDLKDILSQRVSSFEDRQNILETVGKIKSEKNNLYAELERLSLLLPRKESLPEIITMIETVARTNGITIQGLTIGRGSNDNGMGQINIKLNSEGSYENFYYLLKTMEKNLRLLDIARISISEITRNSSENNLIEFSVDGNVYWLSEIERIDEISSAKISDEN